ncbi:MAG: YceI family protein [Nitrospirae bacterium]|nr:YceI family protein [Nitrospirota bacterium]
MVARDRIHARIIIGGLLAVLWVCPAWAETARYDVDLDHSTVEFRVAHMVDPTMTYKLKSYLKTGGGNEYSAVGELTLLGVTKEVVLTGTFNGVAKDPWGNVRAGFTAEGTMNRKDFGMNWSKTLDNGGLVVGDEVHIKLDIECIKAK